jgi:hypothetical protein
MLAVDVKPCFRLFRIDMRGGNVGTAMGTGGGPGLPITVRD